MPQGSRLQMDRALHYVVLRAAEDSGWKQAIFRDVYDRQEFLRRMPDALTRTRARCHGYCLTYADVRLLLELTDLPVGKFVQQFLSYYSRWLNQRHGSSGPVFQAGS